MIEISVASGKGGVGKSTVSASLLLYLKMKGWDVIGVDADADAPNLHLILGVDSWNKIVPFSDSKVASILETKCIGCGRCKDACPNGAIYVENGIFRVKQVYCEGCITCKLSCPIPDAIKYDIIETGVIRETITDYRFPLVSARLRPGRPNSGKIVTKEKERARELAGNETVIVIDSASGIGCQVISSIAGANMVILVTEPTPAGFSDLRRIHKLTRHFMQPAALIINKYDTNMGMTRELVGYANKWNIYLLGLIPYDDSIPYSMTRLRPVTQVYPGSKAARALNRIGRRVESIIKNWSEWMIKYRPKKPEPYKPILIKPKIK